MKQLRYIFIARNGKEFYGKTIEDVSSQMQIRAAVEKGETDSAVRVTKGGSSYEYRKIFVTRPWSGGDILTMKEVTLKEYLKTIGRLEEVYI